MKSNSFIKWIAIINVLTALSTFGFWIGFFTEITFPINELKLLIDNFDGYYKWERCFVVPDVILSTITLIASIQLLKNYKHKNALIILAACGGAWIFLGVLDFTYGMTNGMYVLNHSFSYSLLSIGVLLPIVGTLTVYTILKQLNYENK